LVGWLAGWLAGWLFNGTSTQSGAWIYQPNIGMLGYIQGEYVVIVQCKDEYVGIKEC